METLKLSEKLLGELEMAFENASYEMTWYLDTEEVELMPFGPDIPAVDREPREGAADWVRESHARLVEAVNDTEGRYLRVPTADSREGWQDMADFVSTVEDDDLRRDLDRAIDGKGAFRRFKDTLSRDSDERERWFEFKSERTTKRIRHWLKSYDFELVVEDEDEE